MPLGESSGTVQLDTFNFHNLVIFGVAINETHVGLGEGAAPLGPGVCQRCCPPISCGVSDLRDADFIFRVEPDRSGGLPVSR